ncbi:MAG: hypothetical protein JNM93_10490 [Bacteriovoracaceae bacterium]|nr:hypothetical protein [Bacteriovoracaceae bacterium]
MIKIEITSATNTDLLGTRTFHKNSITIGNRLCDVFIEHEGTFFLDIIDEQLHFNNQKTRYKLNSKTATLSKNLKVNDTIAFENVEFKILEFSTSAQLTKREFLNREVETLLNTNPEGAALLKELQKNLS